MGSSFCSRMEMNERRFKEKMEPVRVSRAKRLNAAWDDYQIGGETPLAHVYWLMSKYATTAAKCPWYVDMKGEIR